MTKKISPDDFSLRELEEAIETCNLHESVTTDLFPTITGEIINAKVIEAYQGVAKVGDQLVTIVPNKYWQEKISGFTSGDTPNITLEGQEYNTSSISEKYIESIKAEKLGRIIQVTEEMILMDQTRSVMNAADDIGRQIGNTRVLTFFALMKYYDIEHVSKDQKTEGYPP